MCVRTSQHIFACCSARTHKWLRSGFANAGWCLCVFDDCCCITNERFTNHSDRVLLLAHKWHIFQCTPFPPTLHPHSTHTRILNTNQHWAHWVCVFCATDSHCVCRHGRKMQHIMRTSWMHSNGTHDDDDVSGANRSDGGGGCGLQMLVTKKISFTRGSGYGNCIWVCVQSAICQQIIVTCQNILLLPIRCTLMSYAKCTVITGTCADYEIE